MAEHDMHLCAKVYFRNSKIMGLYVELTPADELLILTILIVCLWALDTLPISVWHSRHDDSHVPDSAGASTINAAFRMCVPCVAFSLQQRTRLTLYLLRYTVIRLL